MEQAAGDDEDMAALRRLIAASERIVALTGAGISTESGIPDFRSPGGIWTRMKPITYGEFLRSEEARLEDWRRRFVMNANFAEAHPNAGHRGLARMAEQGRLAAVITQNIDGLHQRAGLRSDRLIEIHGNAMKGRCLECRTAMPLAEAKRLIETTGASPRCGCGGVVKAAIISFGQPMPAEEMRAATELAQTADLFLVIGSSLQVRPAATLPALAKRAGAALAIINREETPLDPLADVLVRQPIGSVFRMLDPQLVN